jgi:hypothetical protein
MHEVLYPKLRYRQVADFADPTPAADTDRRATVRVDLGLQFNPEVARDALDAQHLAEPTHYRS